MLCGSPVWDLPAAPESRVPLGGISSSSLVKQGCLGVVVVFKFGIKPALPNPFFPLFPFFLPSLNPGS